MDKIKNNNVTLEEESKSIDWIAVEMFGGARSTAYRKNDELIESIAQWSNLIK
ncbi:hypothetical protein [Clostridium botulinum]|uniref:hypothetical protein n=1 Tax=Clostridium botulinum TaxID=1491 RepID=UPI001FA86101|nr:hypothetical protein [Clostridium botulinum]